MTRAVPEKHIINFFGLNSGRPSLRYENNFMLGIVQPN